MGTIVLPARHLDAAGVERDCMVRCASDDELIIEIASCPTAGKRVVCRIGGLGTLGGTVAESGASGFGLIHERGRSGSAYWSRGRT